MVITAIIVAPYAIFARIYYGTVIPQSVAAKAMMERHPGAEWSALAHRLWLGSPVQWVFGAAFFVGAFIILRSRRELRPVLLWFIGYVFAFSTIGRWWPWYWPPAVWGYAVVSAHRNQRHPLLACEMYPAPLLLEVGIRCRGSGFPRSGGGNNSDRKHATPGNGGDAFVRTPGRRAAGGGERFP